MNENTCPQCGAKFNPGESFCSYCGFAINGQGNGATQTQIPLQQPQINIYNQSFSSPINPSWPVKNKVVAGLLAILLGGIGIHKFYMGKIGKGILYLLFCWTGIPAIAGLIEGIIYLCSSDEDFQLKNRVRIG